MAIAVERLPHDPAILYFDVQLFNTPRFGSVYLLDDDRLAVLEAGTSLTVDNLLAGIAAAGFRPADVDYLIVSHIHLDHAGGAGYLLRTMPNARLVVHQAGAKHLVDPTRLVESARAALGDTFRDYGEMVPVPAERLVVVGDELSIDLGQRALRVIHAPGHAPHHVVVWDERSRSAFTGDGAGLSFVGGPVLPITPAPSFDLEQNVASLRRLQTLRPKALLFSHYGPHFEVDRVLDDQVRLLNEWSAFVAESRRTMGEREMAEALVDTYGRSLGPYSRRFVVDRVENSVRGLVVYHEKKASSAK